MAMPGGLGRDGWQRVKELFGAALERPPGERSAFLEGVCGPEESDVRREVEALLAAHGSSSSFLEVPASALAPPPSERGLVDGQALGPYRVLRVLGQGGMATVYLARDERHHRAVALKVLHPELASLLGPQRFAREIEVEANLTHPHILPLYDSGEAAGRLYYVMPFIEGESLRDRLNRETQLPVEDALQIAREVADALAYAHGQGIIHRDIKPENILLSGGHALVADFGIARVLGQAEGGHLTQAGMAIGTAAYMSPEQARAAEHIDGRTDVYSLGCVLYEMLAGELPYAGPTAQAMMAKRHTDPVPRVRRVRPSIPESVDEAVTMALSPLPADRPATAAEFARALQAGPPVSSSRPSALLPGARGRRRELPVAAVTLVLGFLIGLGVLFAWRRGYRDVEGTGGKVLAVLPFENLGDSADAYFADGVANDVRTKLSRIKGLVIIARSSSNEYRHTTKPPQEIARELGVDYLLTATIQWERAAGGASRVRVTPELVDVRPGRAPHTRWGQQFDAAMTGVFAVQADIADRVAAALDVALGDSARRQLAERPTQNLAAYDAYLRGYELFSRTSSTADWRRATEYFAEAVSLDSNFAQAWAQLSRMHTLDYLNATPTPERARQALAAALRARALAPHSPEAHLAMGAYYSFVSKDSQRAAEELSEGRKLAPNSIDLLVGSSTNDRMLGRLDSAIVHMQRAERIDPRSAHAPGNLAQTYLWLRRHAEAREAADRSLVLAPHDLDWRSNRAMVSLAEGDLAGARAVIAAAPEDQDPADLVASFGNWWDLYWVLNDSQQRLLLGLTPGAFGDDRGVWGLVLAQTHSLRGDHNRSRAYADSARIALEAQVREAPEDAQRHIFLGLALGHLGRKADAVREGRRGVALRPLASDALFAPYIQHQLVRIYLLVGDTQKALDELEPLLKVPYYLTPRWLEIDPNFAPLEGNPRFERLVKGS